MPKNDNAHSIRMKNALEKSFGTDIAIEFEEKHPLSQSADVGKKYEWAKEICCFLEERFKEEQIVSIRRECRCNDGKSIAQKMLKYLKRSENIKSFTEDFNRNETFARLEYIGENKLLFCYPQCYCACVKRIPEPLPKTWCYCTLGNAQGIFEELFQKEVTVSLLESIKTGAAKCVIEVEW